MRDRQRELDKAFKKVAAAQRLALSVLAEHSQRKLARDKNAHKKVPEFDEVNRQLQERLERHREILRREYEYKVANASRVLALEKENLEIQFQRKAREIQHEHLLASQGGYMAFVEGRRAAEDDEHTEVSHSEPYLTCEGDWVNSLSCRRTNPKPRLTVDVFARQPKR
jgi:hypothetical protein